MQLDMKSCWFNRTFILHKKEVLTYLYHHLCDQQFCLAISRENILLQKKLIINWNFDRENLGNPSRIICDKGRKFQGKEIGECCRNEKIEYLLITTGIPKVGEYIEHLHIALMPVLSKLFIEDFCKVMQAHYSSSKNFK